MVASISPSSTQFKLVVDPNNRRGRDALRCLMALSAVQADAELVRDKTVEFPELVVGNNNVSVSTSYAIARYLLASSKQHTLLQSHANSPAIWSIESLVFWSLSDLGRALEGVDKDSIHRALSLLSTHLTSSKSGFLIQDGLTLADVFVWSALVTSRVVSHPAEFLDSKPEIQKYIKTISATPPAQFALQTLFGKSGAVALRAVVPLDADKEKFYLNTAINYTNGLPHIGHAYEAICSDVICRYHRTFGRDVFFQTGTDEHGQKIAQTAEKMGMSPMDMCTMYANHFKDLNASMNINYDFFIRTTNPEHKAICQNIWNLSKANGDIYLDKYIGWYNVREETFVTEFEAQGSDYKDPVSGVPLQKMEEVSYFFKMSRYQQQLIEHINSHPEFILPDFRRNEILARLKEPLMDLSASRTNFAWGVPVPDDPEHVMYVWFDALVNYASGVGVTTDNVLTRYWPSDVNVIGKDIIWFHCVIWPCILMSAGIPLPISVLAHGFVVAGDGKKMSKSLGNVVDPVELLTHWSSADTFRFYLVKTAEVGRDLRFDTDGMVDVHNNDLADTLGNLVHRVIGLCQKFCDGNIPDCSLPEGEPPFDFDSVLLQVDAAIKKFCLQEALEIVMQATRETNKYLTNRAPWAVTDVKEKQKICRAVLEALYLLAHFLEAFMPVSSEEIFKRLGTPKTQLRSLSSWFNNLKPFTPVTAGEVLFLKRTAEGEDVAAAVAKTENKS